MDQFEGHSPERASLTSPPCSPARATTTGPRRAACLPLRGTAAHLGAVIVIEAEIILFRAQTRADGTEERRGPGRCLGGSRRANWMFLARDLEQRVNDARGSELAPGEAAEGGGRVNDPPLVNPGATLGCVRQPSPGGARLSSLFFANPPRPRVTSCKGSRGRPL